MPTILVVEDYSVTMRVLTYTLEKAGFEVLQAEDGHTALDLLQGVSPDLAIIDVAMPEMDGITLLHHLRGSQQFKSLPVIMLTASSADRDRLAARAAGADAFLTKPASSSELVSTIDNLLSAS